MTTERKPTLYEFNAGFLRLLECPVCLKPMLSEIRQCENSHTLCSLCAVRLETCPTCRGTIIDMRCLPMERVAECVLAKCEFADSGCNIQLLKKDMPAHTSICPYRNYECLPGRHGGCNWKGKRNEIYAHVAWQHTNFALTGDDDIIVKTLAGLDFDTEFHNYYVIAKGGEAFWLHEVCRPDAGKFYIAVQYVGPNRNAGAFDYTVVLSSKETKHSYQTGTHCDAESVDDIITAEKCACISIPKIQSLVEKDTFRYEILIENHTP